MSELKPCPFCGNTEPEFERAGTPRQSCIVACGECGARHESSDEGKDSGASWNRRAQPAQAGHLHQALTDPENQPNQYGIEFFMHGPKFAFKVGTQQFTLDYEPTEPGEFEFMRNALIHAFSTFTPDVKPAQAGQVLTGAIIEELAVKYEAFGFGRVDHDGLTTHGFDPDGLQAFVRAIEAAVLAKRVPMTDDTDLIRQLDNALARCRFDSLNMSIADMKSLSEARAAASKRLGIGGEKGGA